MNENEKAAIAARVWPSSECDGGGDRPCAHHKFNRHDIPAPDMHDPVNWLRGLENVRRRGGSYSLSAGISNEAICLLCIPQPVGSDRINYESEGRAVDVNAAVFAAFVALHDVEHSG